MGFFLLLTIEQVMSDVRHRKFKSSQWPITNNSTAYSSIVIVQPQSQPLPIIEETDEDNSVLIESSDNNSGEVQSRNMEESQIQSNGEKDVDHSSVRVTAMIIALSIHSTFEGN